MRRLILPVFGLTACGDPPQPPLDPVPVQGRPEAVFVPAPEPSLAIGLADGPDEFMFSDIAGAARLRDGGVVVAVRGYHEVRRFGPDGEHLWTVGRQGQGPGEFLSVRLLSSCSRDSVAVAHDSRNNTITTIDSGGNVIASDRFERFPLGYAPTCSPSGRLVFSDWSDMHSDQPMFRWTNALAYANDVQSDTELLREGMPGSERFQVIDNGVPVMSGPRPWGRQLLYAATNEGVWMGTGDIYEAEHIDWTGVTTRHIRWAGPDQNVYDDHLDAHRDELCGGYRLLGYADWQDQCAQRWEQEGPLLPPTFPSIGQILVARDGRLWIQHFRRPGAAREWLVFDVGTWVSTVQLPARMFLQDAGVDWILVRHTTDDLGVETLAVYPITSQ